MLIFLLILNDLQKIEDINNTTLGTPNQFQWKFNTQPQATTSVTNSFSALESDTYKQLSGNRSKEPYHSKGSMERERGTYKRFALATFKLKIKRTKYSHRDFKQSDTFN